MVQAEAVRLLGLLSDAGVQSWVDGGWGVEALLGGQTREHSDLDLVVNREHLSGPLLSGAGSTLCHLGYEPRDHDRVDVGLLAERFGVPVPDEYSRASHLNQLINAELGYTLGQ